MTEKEILFSAIRTQVCGAEREDYGALSDERLRALYRLSKAHDMAHLVAAELECRGLLRGGSEVSEKFRKQQMLAVFRYERSKYELDRICAALERAEIPFVTLKGTVIRAYYPEPWMRTSSDIDFLVHGEDLERIRGVLENELGIRYDSSWHHEESFFAESGVHIEFHDGLGSEKEEPNEILENGWQYVERKEGFQYWYEMTDPMFYFYHHAHMAKHFKAGGCGVKPFVDSWILTHRMEHDDKARAELLEKGGLLTFAKACETLSEAWFGNGRVEGVLLDMEQFVLDGGVYGHMDNRVAVEQTRKGGKSRYIRSRLFLPYETLKFSYPILEKHRWLMPICSVCRLFRLVFRRGTMKRSVSELKRNQSITKDEAQKTGNLLRQIGL